MKSKIKRTIAILLAVCFLVSLTATAVSASPQDFKRGYRDGYRDGYKDGFDLCILHQKAAGWGRPAANEVKTFEGDYGKGYDSGYSTGHDRGYKACDPVPEADFSAAPTAGKAPLKVTFYDQSTENPVNWKWEFGDGTTSTQRDPTHTYVSGGTYTVKLTVKNKTGSDTITRFDYIIVKA